MKTYMYDLADDNGINSLELPIKLEEGSIFTCEWGKYEVMNQEQFPTEYTRIYCERI